MYTESVKNAIGKLDNIDPNTDLAYEQVLLALTTIKSLPVLVYQFNETFPVYRTRTHLEDATYGEIKEIAISPPQYVKGFARCNKPQQSVFYCSENRPTSYMELVNYWVENTNPGDKLYVTLGRWQLLNPLRVLVITSPDTEKRNSDYDHEHGEALDKSIAEEKNDDLRESYIIFHRYMFDLFRKPANDDLKIYMITSAYCNLVNLEFGDHIDAIYYPSVQFAGQGNNFAIKKEWCTSENIQLTHVIKNEFTVTLQENGKHSFTETNFVQANSVDLSTGNINW